MGRNFYVKVSFYMFFSYVLKITPNLFISWHYKRLREVGILERNLLSGSSVIHIFHCGIPLLLLQDNEQFWE